MTGDEDDDFYEEHSYFTGGCTCEHDPEQHGWGSCGQVDEVTGQECPCEAGWEE